MATWTDGPDTIWGTDQNDNLFGGGGNDTIYALAGDDTLDGGTGDDTLRGGLGNDTYVVDSVGDQVIESSGAGLDVVKSSVRFTLGPNVETLILTGSAKLNGTGNSLDNTLIGNTAGNILNGGPGADIMRGGAGGDDYAVDNPGDRVIEDPGGTEIDRVESSISFKLPANVEMLILIGSSTINGTGNSAHNAIIGNGADNVLDGKGGADYLQGGSGDDTYIVDNLGDEVVEYAGQGVDLVESSVSFTLPTNVENLTLTGTSAVNGAGNSDANVIVGNSAANILDGHTGADTLKGGGGDDTYFVDNPGDTVTEIPGGGTDLVRSVVSFTLGAYVENLTLDGRGAISGTGNSLDNVITGNSAANLLDGRGGADSLRGAGGNDTYIVDNPGDTVTESADGGTDFVRSSVSFTLGAHVENLTLTGGGSISGTGNGLANIIVGNEAGNVLAGAAGADTINGMGGDDTLAGGAGNDLLTGGAGADKFLFDAPLGSGTNVDTITDYSVADDTIVLDQSVFTELAPGRLSADAFYAGTAAHDLDDRIIYDGATGSIYYDSDGSGPAAQVLFAHITAGLALNQYDFLVVS